MSSATHWIEIGSDAVIGIAQTAIAIFIPVIVYRRRERFPPLGWLFVAFFLASGLARLSDMLTLNEFVTNLAEALMGLAAMCAIWPLGPQVKKRPFAADLMRKLKDKDDALKEKDEVLAALREKSQEMIALQEHDRRQKLLIGELNHRVKNTLAVVQSIARQSLRSAKDKEQFAETFEERLMALAHTHTLLLDSGWENTSFADLSDRLLKHYGKRFRHSGPDLILQPQAALSLGMALHELATNAIKHGAWRCSEGLVDIHISDLENMIQIVWKESGGPAVTPPKGRNFGSKLLHEGIPRELRGTASKEFHLEGIVYTLTIPADAHIRVSGKTPTSFAVSA